ncbi:O-methyltransferase [Sediminibacterium soli]|uniref:O-methyltransferase n=1 Tax=Sediminibacterium soli TaxID=2698829 RepID=UPI0013795397|nr:class I SAM-dependent methyltransferase [Sediminibacterium soli]NCI47150.1 class I SAM-dependent methyltransferase [Sediminibacterium soli]
MYSPFRLGIRYLQYYLKASNGKGHGIHSPFVFEFVTKVLNDDRHFYAYRHIENLRKLLLNDTRVLTIEDMGAGSRVKKTNERSVKDIAASSLKPGKYSQLLFRMVNRYAPANMLELGTSLGITTAYLAAANEAAKVITMEGAPAVAAVARENFSKLQLDNIQVTQGNFDETLAHTVQAMGRIDLCFVDGNHRYEPTLRYYRQLLPALHEHSILVFDDIHWSREMEQAWETIKQQQEVTLTIDLFFIGIVFFRRENREKQHFTIRF